MEEEDEFVAAPQLENPYRTPEPHPFLETAYDLGLLATRCAGRQRSGEEGRRGGLKNNLREFSRNVCYLVKKSWLQRRDMRLPATSGGNEGTVDDSKVSKHVNWLRLFARLVLDWSRSSSAVMVALFI